MIDWATFPSLTALRAFSALAETGSAVAAGARLNVSHAAISQQVKALEVHMGLALVDRSGRELALTTEGRELAAALTLGFGAISRAVDTLTGRDADRPLQVSTTQQFATTWLMPRLPDFQAQHPDIDLMLNPTPALADPEPGGIDIAIRFGTGDWPGLDAQMLVPAQLVVSASPDLVGDREFTHPSELLDYPWLQELGTTEASGWLRRHGVAEGRARRITQLPGNLLLDGARTGQGIVMTTTASVRADLSAGRLRILFQDDGATGYHIVTRPGILRPPARAFAVWLRRQAASGRTTE